MPTRFLSDAELAQLSGFPADIAAEDLVTYFALTEVDRRWLADEHRRAANQLGAGLQYCTLLWLGFVPDDLTTAPPPVVGRLANQLTVDAGVLVDYGGWQDRTRRDHLRQVLARAGWRAAGTGELKRLDDFLLVRAVEHDSPTLLLHLAAEHLRAERVVRPSVVPLVRRVATARERAWTETYARFSGLADGQRGVELDRLVEVDPVLGFTRLVWLRRGATAATPEAIKVELEKLGYLRGLDADRLDLSAVPPGRRRFLAQVGRRSTPQALARSAVERRHPVLLATLAETAVEVLDELVTLFDHGLTGAFLLRYLADIDLRRKIGRQLNKGETLQALRRALFFANQGHVRRAHHDDQTEQALCLTVVTNTVVLWNTVYLQDTRSAMAEAGRPVDDDAAAHLSPAQSDYINPYGNYTFDIERELSRTGRRPLQSPPSAPGLTTISAPLLREPQTRQRPTVARVATTRLAAGERSLGPAGGSSRGGPHATGDVRRSQRGSRPLPGWRGAVAMSACRHLDGQVRRHVTHSDLSSRPSVGSSRRCSHRGERSRTHEQGGLLPGEQCGEGRSPTLMPSPACEFRLARPETDTRKGPWRFNPE